MMVYIAEFWHILLSTTGNLAGGEREQGERMLTSSGPLGGAGTQILVAGIAFEGLIFFLSSKVFSDTTA